MRVLTRVSSNRWSDGCVACRFCDASATRAGGLANVFRQLGSVAFSHLVCQIQRSVAVASLSDNNSGDVWAPWGVSQHGQDRGVIPGPFGWVRVNSPDWVRHLWRCFQGDYEYLFVLCLRENKIGMFLVHEQRICERRQTAGDFSSCHSGEIVCLGEVFISCTQQAYEINRS